MCVFALSGDTESDTHFLVVSHVVSLAPPFVVRNQEHAEPEIATVSCVGSFPGFSALSATLMARVDKEAGLAFTFIGSVVC